MKMTWKRALAVLLALLLALPGLALAEDEQQAVQPELAEVIEGELGEDGLEPSVEEQTLELGGDEEPGQIVEPGTDEEPGQIVEAGAEVTGEAIDAALAADAEDPETMKFTYIDAKGKKQGPVECTVIINNNDRVIYLNSGWYAVTTRTYCGYQMVVTGDVNLLLCDGEALEVRGVKVEQKASLTIWAQSTGDSMGTLDAHSTTLMAGIGGGYNEVAGPIIINGGRIYAEGGEDSAGIGGGCGRASGFTRIEIHGGHVRAEGGTRNHTESGIGIGAYNRTKGDFIITGGVVEAFGHGYGSGIYGRNITISGNQDAGESVTAHSAGKGAGIQGDSVTINSGYVKATSTEGAGIGGGVDENCHDVAINGGTVIAKGGEDAQGHGSAGIGGGTGGDLEGTVTITGGTVEAIGAGHQSNKDKKVGGGAGIGGGWQGTAGNGKGTVIITGGKVTAIGGEKAAGIGGGCWGGNVYRGSGAKVTISGDAVVKAKSGGGRSSAIGHGEDSPNFGELYIADHMQVRAGFENVNERKPAFTAYEREGACKYRWMAVIQPCSHPGATISGIDGDTHTIGSCKYCNVQSLKVTHSFNEKTHKCKVCGYEAPFHSIAITFDANGGKGRMGSQKAPSNLRRVLKANAFTWEGHTFKCWNTERDGSGQTYFDRARISLRGSTTLYAQWYTHVTLVSTGNKEVWNGKPITASGYKCQVDGKDISLDFPGVSASRTETDAGTYPIKFQGVKLKKTIDSTQKYIVTKVKTGELVIEEAEPEFTAPVARELTYDGEKQTLVEPGNAHGGKMQYSLNGKTWRRDVPTAKNAGEYTLWYRVNGDKNHKDTKAQSVTVTIAPRNLTIKADRINKYVGKKDPKLSYKYEGLLKGDKLTGALTREKGETAGKYAIQLGTLSAGKNYTIEFIGEQLIIENPPAK